MFIHYTMPHALLAHRTGSTVCAQLIRLQDVWQALAWVSGNTAARLHGHPLLSSLPGLVLGAVV